MLRATAGHPNTSKTRKELGLERVEKRHMGRGRERKIAWVCGSEETKSI